MRWAYIAFGSFWRSPWLSVPGLDWSEDSADDVDDDDDEDEAGAFIPFQSSWRPRNGSVSQRASPHHVIGLPGASCCDFSGLFVWTGWKMTTAPPGKHGSWDFALTSSTNISTCAGRREPAYAKRSIATPSAKPCCTQPVTTQTVPGSSSRNYVVPPEGGQGIFFFFFTNVRFKACQRKNVSVLVCSV